MEIVAMVLVLRLVRKWFKFRFHVQFRLMFYELGFGGMIGVGLSSDPASPLMNAPLLSVFQLLIFCARVIRSLWLLSLVKSLHFKFCSLRFFEEGSGLEAQFRLFGMLSRFQSLLHSSLG
ncbi:unnamed protein product [Arabis nemorensis]|uniref:Uncharacterized protein n=1 Tax=Arabis nemorensis TaxID=586526 RepID=A0A565B2D8_9BRAS|nr:unnamed protein product [Arabis nemorensis]